MSECEYFGLGRVCNVKKIGCISVDCKQHPDYYRHEAQIIAHCMQKAVGKRVRAYKNAQKYVENNPCIHGRLVKVFVKGNSVAYKVRDGKGNVLTCSDVQITMFQD